MAGYNRVVMIGNLTRDPDFKQLASGQAVCKLSLATNRQFRNKQNGNMIQEVCYIDIDVWGPQAESCRQYLAKGRSVLVEGRLKLDTWEDATGANRSKHSIVADRIVFLGSNAESQVEEAGESSSANNGAMRSEMPQPQNEMERELFGQINDIKNRQAKKKKNDSAGEIDFKDEPPFQDELPF